MIRKWDSQEIGTDPPLHVKLFSPGENRSTKGSVFYDPKRREEIREYALSADTRKTEDGEPMSFFDLAHLSLSNTGTVDSHKSYGWFKVSYEEDGNFY